VHERLSDNDQRTHSLHKVRLGNGQPTAKGNDPGRVDKPARADRRTEHLAEMLGELGDYELLEEVGRRGQGVVFRAAKESQPHGCLKGHSSWSVGKRSVPETLSPRS
jgi:hypothetical protein